MRTDGPWSAPAPDPSGRTIPSSGGGPIPPHAAPTVPVVPSPFAASAVGVGRAPNPAEEDPPTIEQIWADARSPSDPQPRHTRIRAGSPFSGRALLGVFGLLSLLVTLAIMGVVGVRVLSGLNEGAVGSVTGGSAVTDAQDGESGTLSGADAAQCAFDRRTLQTAVNAHQAMMGDLPADQDELVSSGLIAEPVSSFSLRQEGDTVVLEGLGACAGA